MLMPPYHGAGLRADEAGILEHFAHVAEASGLPLMVQDAPLSGVSLSVPFLVRLAREVPAVRYFKIEVPGTAAKLRALIEAGGDRDRRSVRRRGVDHADGRPRRRRDRHDAERAAARPHQAGASTHHRAGRRAEAAAAYARILPLINFENRQCGLRATKTVMMEGGVIRSDAVRHPLERAASGDAGRTARTRRATRQPLGAALGQVGTRGRRRPRRDRCRAGRARPRCRRRRTAAGGEPRPARREPERRSDGLTWAFGLPGACVAGSPVTRAAAGRRFRPAHGAAARSSVV